MNAVVNLLMASAEEAEILKRAMSVEEKPGLRSSLSVDSRGNVFSLEVEASDLGSLRAALNSTLREVKIADSALL
jgi:tRNA threonylcarbamoyladenosine modification (KEOPS) complex  Pcc1 subunit